MLLMVRDDLTEALVANLRSLMEARETNAHELAARANMNQTAVYDILSGKARSPKLETVKKLADALSVSVSALIEAPQAAGLRGDIQDVFDRLPEDEQRRLLAIARALLPPSTD